MNRSNTFLYIFETYNSVVVVPLHCLTMVKAKITPVEEDKFVKGANVMGLIECNFYNFLSDKLAAMVMFYNPNCKDCERQRAHIIRAAKVTKRPNHAYAAVDCTVEKELCKRENITRLPTFILYTRGKYISAREFPLEYTRMKDLIDRIEPLPPLHPLQVTKDPECKKVPGK